jgi:hypothetical protein
MPSLVLELQTEAISSDTKVSDLLRKALVVASKLKIREFEEWAKNELQGYKDSTPGYRRVRGSIKAFNPYRGWIPVTFQDAKIAEMLSQKPIGQSVGELEELISGKDKDAVLTIPYPPEILNTLMGDEELVPELVIGHSQVFGVLEAVKNIILEWSLKLEKDGILGEGLTFSTEEKRIAETTTYHVQHFAGPVGAVAGRDINIQISFAEILNRLVNAVETDDKIPPKEKQSIVDKVRSLASNEWVRSIGTSVLAEVIKKSVGI